MSVLVALITRRDGLVASDGRRFAPARFENWNRVQDAEPETDEFNKTFSLYAGKVIGGFVGLLEFSGMTVTEHVRDITMSRLPEPSSLEQVASVVEEELTRRLEQINDREVLLPHRRADVVLVGGSELRRSDFLIIALRFEPGVHPDRIMSTREVVSYQQP